MTLLEICKKCGHTKENHINLGCQAIIDYPIDTEFYLGFNHCDCRMFQ